MKTYYEDRLEFIELNNIECKGCHKIEYHCSFILQFKRNYMNKCPCRECIVKTTCDTYCDERSNLYQESIDKNQHYVALNL